MVKKNNATNSHVVRPKDINDFRKTVLDIKKEGFVPLPIRKSNAGKTSEWEKMMSSVGFGDFGSGNKRGGTFISAVSRPNDEDLNLGTKGLGWMSWGTDNKLPNTIETLTQMLPYTATGWKFNSDVTTGLGPRPKYRYTQYTPGIGIKTKEIDFDAAGPMIRQNMKSMMKELAEIKRGLAEANAQDNESDDESNGILNMSSSQTDVEDNDLVKMLEEDIENLKKDYEKWDKTSKEVRLFMQNTDLNNFLLKMACEYHYTGMCFPELQLSSDLDVATNMWKPKVTGLGLYSCWITRLERRDEKDDINYVYISNKWLEGKKAEAADITVKPALDPNCPGRDLKKRLVDIRTENKMKPKDRPTRYVIPVSYPSPGHPYYTQPSWYSIFGGNIYEYASTIISDRAVRRKNSNIIGRIIYVHTGYLEQLFLQRNAQSQKDRENVFNSIITEINAFLRDPENSGESLFAYSFIGNDGKEHDSYKIVEIPASNKNSADANKTELEEVCNILFFAQQIQPSIIGATPGHSGSSGGTYQREMLLIKQLLLSPTQSLLMKPFEAASLVNEWDDHLVWRVQQMALTTLDNSKTGMQEQETT